MTATAAQPATSVFAAEHPTLPSGTAGLAPAVVAASQRQRLIHGVTIAVADKGFAAATIADVTERAGVSKKTFYAHFTDKTACFLAAYDHGSAAILTQTAGGSASARADGVDAVGQLRAGTGAYLDFLVTEAPYARTFCLEMLAAGPEAIARHRGCRQAFAAALQTWHAVSRAEGHPDWPQRPALAFEAATGVVHELTSARVASDRAAELPALLDDLVAAQLALLDVP